MKTHIRYPSKSNEGNKNVKKPYINYKNKRLEARKRFNYNDEDFDCEKSEIFDNDNCGYNDSDLSSDSEEFDAPDSKEKRNFSKIMFMICIIIIIILLSFYLWKNIDSSSTVYNYSRQFNKLINEFPAQTEISWKILNNTLAKQILRKQPITKPSVIILVGESGKVEHFIETLIELVIRKCPMYKQATRSENIDNLKLDLSDFLSKLVRDDIRCAYLPEIDNIPPSLGPLLHGLSDESNALYKEMIYIFSLKINQDNNKLESPPKTDEDAENFLKNQLSLKWEHEQGTERFVALHTRLLVNVVNVL